MDYRVVRSLPEQQLSVFAGQQQSARKTRWVDFPRLGLVWVKVLLAKSVPRTRFAGVGRAAQPFGFGPHRCVRVAFPHVAVREGSPEADRTQRRWPMQGAAETQQLWRFCPFAESKCYGTSAQGSSRSPPPARWGRGPESVNNPGLCLWVQDWVQVKARNWSAYLRKRDQTNEICFLT